MTDDDVIGMPNATASKPELTLSKIVATPTLNSWSQAYNAGNLFAVLSIEKKEEYEEKDYLNLLGKEILNTLEEEYFSLETKNLESIKKAVSLTCKKIPDNVLPCLLIASVVNNILYIFVLGNGKAILKRKDKTGAILDSSSEKLVATSGFLEDNDIVILETKQFADIVSKEMLFSSLDHNTTSEIAEVLSPKIHEKEEGGAASIILFYKTTKSEELEEIEEDKNEDIANGEDEKIQVQERKKQYFEKITKQFRSIKSNFTHSKKVFLTVALILVLILFVSIIFSIKKQEDAKTKAFFQEVFPSAQKKYNDGSALLGLNKNLAKDNLSAAQKILNENKSKFKPKSNEEKQILDLLKKAEENLTSASEVNSVQAKEVGSDKSSLLDFEAKNPSKITQFAQDDKNIYFVDENGVYSVEKSSENKKTIVKNNNAWKEAGGIGAYIGNIYVLDKKGNQIFKFVGEGDSFEKSNYLQNDQMVDFSKVQSLAIDGSVWIISLDGSIFKFTRGKRDDFKISGLDKPFVNPTKIFTNTDMDNLYVLDNGNSRIVVLNKEGVYQAQYQSSILKTAKDFEVMEKDKKIYFLSKDKIYEMDLK